MGFEEKIIGVAQGIGMAIFYSLLWYASKYQKGEKFDPKRFLRVLILGALIGIGSVALGVPVKQETVNEQLAVLSGYGFLIALVDKLVVIIMRTLGWTRRS